METRTIMDWAFALLLMATLVPVVGCGKPPKKSREQKMAARCEVITIFGCEYILYMEGGGTSSRTGMAHKGNCKFCAGISK